jgi:hypothetical protein
MVAWANQELDKIAAAEELASAGRDEHCESRSRSGSSATAMTSRSDPLRGAPALGFEPPACDAKGRSEPAAF